MKGTYLLLIELGEETKMKIGALGRIEFKKGKYAYIGSALNNLEKRIKRHLRKKKKKHWHIDYFLDNKNAKIKRVYFIPSSKRMECKLARKIAKIGKGIKGFGCSDCDCKSHLFKLEEFSIQKGFKILEELN